MDYKCKICDNTSDYTTYIIREMQLGMREKFNYVYCHQCHCIQIETIPENLGDYYPSKDYYSFSTAASGNKLFSVFTDVISKNSFYNRGLLSKIVGHFGLYDYSLLAVGKLNPPKDFRILDVGSGGGQLLFQLKKLGYTHLTGIDPFITKSVFPVDIRKINLEDLDINEKYDLIMFHHSFEHVLEPYETLTSAKKHLSDNGIIMIRTPLVTYAFEKYKENWFQLDAPRHIHLQSIRGIELMVAKAGLTIMDMYCDSRDEQFYVSENYRQDISMNESKKGPVKSLLNVLFSSKRASYRKEAKRLNEEMKGDTVVYCCRYK